MDRSISRILSLPIFDDPFVAALRKLGLDRVEFWMVLTEEDSSLVSVEISDLLSVMTESDRDTVELILSKPELVDLLGQIYSGSVQRKDPGGDRFGSGFWYGGFAYHHRSSGCR